MGRPGNCAADGATGKGEARFRDRQGAILVDAAVNGQRGRFIVDTGATLVSVSRQLAARAGISTANAREVLLQTASGTITGLATKADKVQLQGAAAKNVSVVVHPAERDPFGAGIDGLLGLSFLAQFDMTISGNRLSLTPPQAAPP